LVIFKVTELVEVQEGYRYKVEDIIAWQQAK